MVMEYMQYIFIGLGLVTILGAVIYFCDKVCAFYACFLFSVLLILIFDSKCVCLCECMCERDLERKWVYMMLSKCGLVLKRV